MSAQAGNAVTLAYREQGAQQGGAAVLLSYTPPAAIARKTVADFEAPWGASSVRNNSLRAPMGLTTPVQHSTRNPWIEGQRLRRTPSRIPWGVAQAMDALRRSTWLPYAGRPLTLIRVPWVLSAKQDREQAQPWGSYAHHLVLQHVAPWGVAIAQDRASVQPWGQYASRLANSAGGTWVKARTADREQWHPWTLFSRAVDAAWGVVIPVDAPGPAVTFYLLPARFYMTTHDVYAERLPDLAEIPIYDATVSADTGSYCWTLSASGPASLFAQLAPVDGLPVRLRVTMDGIPWVFAIDTLQRNQAFGKAGVSITGRSVTALVGAPFMRAVTRNNAGASLLAQQLAISALQDTSVDLDWGLTDWLVPAGAWSHQGTPLDAVQAIAQAAGGYLQSHRSAATLLTRHPYGQRAGDNPGAPWSWMTGAADVELAPDAIITEGLERKDGADINAVYVSGTTQGVLGLVKRTGSAADKLATMVTDPLIVHVDAARQRGLSILGAAGAKYYVRQELPVLTGAGQPGVLDVGQLVQINAATPWRGRVRAVSAVYKRPTLRQTITIERHLEIA